MKRQRETKRGQTQQITHEQAIQQEEKQSLHPLKCTCSSHLQPAAYKPAETVTHMQAVTIDNRLACGRW